MTRRQTAASLKLLLSAAMILPGASPAWAGMWDSVSQFQKPNMKWGMMSLHPYYRFSEMYDSNIFLQPRSKVAGNNANNNAAGPVLGSWITGSNLGVKLSLPMTEAHRFDLGYDFLWLAYSKDPDVNNAVHQKADGGYRYRGPMGVSGSVKNAYMNTTDPATSELTQRAKRWQNTFSADGEYAPKGGNLFVGADAAHTTHKYIQHPDAVTANLPALLNRYEQQFGVKGGWKLAPKTRLFTAYHRQLIHYSVFQAAPAKSNKAHMVDFGMEGVIAPKLTGQVQTGFQYREYDKAPAATPITRVTRNWTLGTKLTYKPMERCAWNLGLARNVQESTFGTSRFYISNTASLGMTHKLPYKLSAGLNASVGFDKYPETGTLGGVTRNRRDDLYQQDVALDYAIQEWMKTGIRYTHRQKHSVFSEQFNYDDHQTTLNFGLTF